MTANDRRRNSNHIFYIACNVNLDFDVYFVVVGVSTVVAQYRKNL